MGNEIRRIVYDRRLDLEAILLQGIACLFPAHFHEEYVVGCIEQGIRRLNCTSRLYDLTPGTLIVFAPGTAHACTSLQEETLSYRSLCIRPDVLDKLLESGAQPGQIPFCVQTVISDLPIARAFCALHERIMNGEHQEGLKDELAGLLRQIRERYPAAQERKQPPAGSSAEKSLPVYGGSFSGADYDRRGLPRSIDQCVHASARLFTDSRDHALWLSGVDSHCAG